MKSREPLSLEIVGPQTDSWCADASGKYGVFGAIPGETVVAQPFTRRKRRTFARTIEVVEAAAERVVAPCAAADYCGGCAMQHIDPPAQLQSKHDRLVALLESTPPGRWLSPLEGPVRNYRSKARLGVKYVRNKERVLVGFREKMSPFIADVDQCVVLVEPVASLLPALAELISGLSVIRALPQIEVAVGEDGTALVFRHLEPLTAADTEAFVAFGERHNIWIYLQSGGPDDVFRLWPETAIDRLHYSLPAYDLAFAFHPMDFTQVNQAINRQLVDLALTLLEPAPSDHCLDLFCGMGNFSLPLARHCENVSGVELSKGCVDRAVENAARNQVGNVSFSVGDLFNESTELPGLADIDRVLLDPPRSGAEAVCKRLATCDVERVVYVSCNPQTLARDAGILVENGFHLDSAGVIDMFPHTAHVESIACFTRTQ